jgi:hypothetical protein
LARCGENILAISERTSSYREKYKKEQEKGCPVKELLKRSYSIMIRVI